MSIIFSGRNSKYLSEKIAKSYGAPLGKSSITVFADGEQIHVGRSSMGDSSKT